MHTLPRALARHSETTLLGACWRAATRLLERLRPCAPLWAAGLAAALGAAAPMPSAAAGLVTIAVAPLHVARYGHTSTLLNDGRVLVVGGRQDAAGATRVTEVYDPRSNSWTVAAPSLGAHAWHQAVRLRSGKVLVLGGDSADYEIYDPVADRWSEVAPMALPQFGSLTATLLKNGLVLVAGGASRDPCPYLSCQTAAAQVYDPANDSWRRVAPMNDSRQIHAAVRLDDGRVFVSGGRYDFMGYTHSAEVYDPRTNRWTRAPNMPAPRSHHAQIVMPDGRVAVFGGAESCDFIAEPDCAVALHFYDPEENRWSRGDDLLAQRMNPAWVQLGDGSFVISGHDRALDGQTAVARRVDRYGPDAERWARLGKLLAPRDSHTATRLRSGHLLFVGGRDSTSQQPLATVERSKIVE